MFHSKRTTDTKYIHHGRPTLYYYVLVEEQYYDMKKYIFANDNYARLSKHKIIFIVF